MKFDRYADADLWESQAPPPRNEQLRELVDGLPKIEQHLVSRVYFGGAPLTEAAEEIGVEVTVATRLLKGALRMLRDALQAEN